MKIAAKITIIGLLLCAGLLSGCAKQVTTIPVFGAQLIIEMNYRGAVDLVRNQYFVVISTLESMQVPTYPYEFIEPNVQPSLPEYRNYYFNFYNMWSSYIISDVSSSYYLVNGPYAPSFESYARIPVSNQNQDPRTVYLVVRLDQIFGATIPDKIYFNFISVRDRYLKDQITPPLQGLEKLTGSYISGTDDTDYTIDPSLDLLSWRVRVE